MVLLLGVGCGPVINHPLERRAPDDRPDVEVQVALMRCRQTGQVLVEIETFHPSSQRVPEGLVYF